jgi:hypothetical protein
MIRLLPTSITLGPSDLKDFEKRRKRLKEREAKESLHSQFARYEIGPQDGPSFGSPREPYCNERITGQHLTTHHSPASSPFNYQPLDSPELQVRAGEVDSSGSTSSSASSVPLLFSPENVSVEVEQPSLSPKDEFHYGGFIESPNYNRSPLHSSPFSMHASSNDLDTFKSPN